MSEYICDVHYGTIEDTYFTQGEPVVRCRDCKYGSEMCDTDMLNCTGKLTTCWDYYNDEPQQNMVEPDGFCAWGERREE